MPFYLFTVILVLDVIQPLFVFGSWCYRTLVCGFRGSPGLMLLAFIWVLILVTWPAPHPKCVAAGTCLYFYSGMGHWLYQNCLFDGSGNAVVLPAYYTEIVQGHLMTCDVMVVYDGGWCSHMFPEPFSKSPAWLSNVLIFTIHPSTSLPVDHPTFL